MNGRLVFQHNGAVAYGAAVIFAMAAIGVRLTVLELFQGYPFLTIFPAVILSTFLGGFGPGMLTLLLGGAGAWYFLVPPAHSVGSKAGSDVIGILLYGIVSGFAVWTVAALKTFAANEHEARMHLAAAIQEKSALLHERELLLTEIRHRVGNNLQQITGLLMLHAQRITEPAAKAAFENARARVDLLAEVHQSLYRTGSEMVNVEA